MEHSIDSSFAEARDVCSGDSDGDGSQDVIGVAPADDDVSWWCNSDGLGTDWTEHTISGEFDGAAAVYVADIDGDGDPDVLAAGKTGGQIAWWWI